MKNNSKKSAKNQVAGVSAPEKQPLTGIYLKRDVLKKLSREVKPLIDEGKFKTINEAILNEFYKKDGNETFRTFDQWKQAGFKVKKGERAFLLWAKPVGNEESDEPKFYPIVFLFSNLQVEEFKKGETMVEEAPVKYGLREIEISYKPAKMQWNPEKIGSSIDARKIMNSYFTEFMEYREAFYCLYLNRQNKPIGIYQVSVGGVSGTMVDPKIMMQVALKSHASGIIMAHNHPSGNLQPSQADINLTRKIKGCCELLEITLLDHIILTEESFYSFADEGKL